MQLSIIIVNYNTDKLLKQCLDSVYLQRVNFDFEVIVVDNNSTDKSLEMLSKYFTQVKIISNTKNVGFGKANNQGAKLAKGRWLLFLNSDTQCPDGTLDKVMRQAIAKSSKNSGDVVVGCRLLNSNNSIQASAGFFPTIERVALQMFFLDDLPFVKSIFKPYQQNQVQFYSKDQEVDWVTGAFLLLPNDLFKKVHGFDESIFMYGEEIDLCYRLKKEGARICYVDSPALYHHKGGSSANGFKSAVVGEYKGLVSFYKKHYPKKIIFLKLTLFTGALLRRLVFGIIDQEKGVAYSDALKVL
jgi:GT2 family glycosyltransferase